MLPFRVFDSERKATYIVLNFHPHHPGGGQYLVARDDESAEEGKLELLSAEELARCEMLGLCVGTPGNL